jgi:hypothetical protein
MDFALTCNLHKISEKCDFFGNFKAFTTQISMIFF